MSQNLNTTGLVISDNTAPGTSLTEDLKRYIGDLSAAHNAMYMVQVLARCSELTGRFVEILPDYAFTPVLRGIDNDPVPLYQVVEVLDGLVDYETVKQELPTLSYSQIGGAFSFLRKVAQLNPREIDFDLLEDHRLSEDTVLLDELTKSQDDKEIVRVLNRG
jgi:hypothetical protein